MFLYCAAKPLLSIVEVPLSTDVGKDYEAIPQKFSLIQFIVEVLECLDMLKPLGFRVLLVRVRSWSHTQRQYGLR